MPNPEPKTLGQIKSHYEELRKLTYELTEKEYSSLKVKLSRISRNDAVAADQWHWTDQRKQPAWSWSSMFDAYRGASGLKRFEAAASVSGRLCGLCYGVPNNRRIVLKIHAIARNPESNPLQGRFVELMLFAAITYAGFLGCEELWLVNPVSGLESYYATFGFSEVKDPKGRITHMTRQL